MEEKKTSRLDSFKPNFDTFALGYFKDDKDGQWKLVKIEFDSALKVAGRVNVTHSEPDKASIVERFKIQAAMELDIG